MKIANVDKVRCVRSRAVTYPHTDLDRLRRIRCACQTQA